MKDNGGQKKIKTDARISDASVLRRQVNEVVHSMPVIDVHTHLFPSKFETLSLSGIDEVLTYHYLIAETFRFTPVTPETFWRMPKLKQADLVWRTLFVERTPISEAARGVITILKTLGLDVCAQDLTEAREFFRAVDIQTHTDRIFEMACVESVVMTNDIFDADEMSIWNGDSGRDPRFHSSLRMDRLVNHWKHTSNRLGRVGLSLGVDLCDKTISAIRQYIDECIERLSPLYLALSLPDDFHFPHDTRSRPGLGSWKAFSH